MPVCRDSSIVKLKFGSDAVVPPKQVFCLFQSKGVDLDTIEMLQALTSRNTYDLKFSSDAARVKGVASLQGIEGLTVTPYDRSVVVTVLHLNFEMEQDLVARVLSRYGTVSDMWRCTYADFPRIYNGIRQFRMILKADIPSFLFIGGCKAHTRYLGQPRTCFRCGQEGHEAKACPNKRCGRCFEVGHDQASCPNQVVCTLCGKEGHVMRACPTSYSARASSDVGSAPAPSPPGPEPTSPCSESMSPSSEELREAEEVATKVEREFLASEVCEEAAEESPSSPVEADMDSVEEDLRLSSDSEGSEAEGSSSEPPPKDPPSRDGWFDLSGEVDPTMKRSASEEVSEQGGPVAGAPMPSPRNKKAKSDKGTSGT